MSCGVLRTACICLFNGCSVDVFLGDLDDRNQKTQAAFMKLMSGDVLRANWPKPSRKLHGVII